MPVTAVNPKPSVSDEALNTARITVRELLERSPAYHSLDEVKRRTLARDLVQVGAFMAEPGGVRVPPQHAAPEVLALAGEGAQTSAERRKEDQVDLNEAPKFGTAVDAGVGAAINLIKGVNFPGFVSGLIQGVFHSIVTSSIEQMEAYAKLVADVAKSLNQFRDENTTANQGRDHLLEQFPDLFQLQAPGDGFGGGFGEESSGEPRVALREGIDERQAMARINASMPLDKPITKLDDELVEAMLVPAARTQLATGRQQLLATMVMMGINRIVVTDGKIAAKVMFDFQARDNRRFQKSAAYFDYAKDAYGNVQKTHSGEGDYESTYDGGSYSSSRDKDGGRTVDQQGASSYSKGTYKYAEQPIVTLQSVSKLQDDSSLQSKASLFGHVEVNFKSDYLPLDKMASAENIAAIQMNAQPGMLKTLAQRPAPAKPAAAGGASAPAASPAVSTPST